MRKILVLWVCFIPALCFSQTAFYDAKFLSLLGKNTIDDLKKPFNRYLLSEQEYKTVQAYLSFLDAPFASTITPSDLSIRYLKSAIDKINSTGTDASNFKAKGFENFIQDLNKSTGILGLGPNIGSAIIDGLAKYYAEEFKKAQMVTYMQIFNQTIDEVGELQVLIPGTFKKLAMADPSKFPELGKQYKIMFDEDLRNLLDNVIQHIEKHTAQANPQLEAKLKWLNAATVDKIRKADVFQVARMSHEMSKKLRNNYTLSELFEYMDDQFYENADVLSVQVSTQVSGKLKTIFHTLNLIQKNLIKYNDISVTGENKQPLQWITIKEFKELTTVTEWKYFLGLIYQQDPAFFNQYLKHNNIFPEAADHFNFYKQKFAAFTGILGEIQDFKLNLKDSTIQDNYGDFMKLIIRVFKQTNYLLNINLNQNNDFDKIEYVANRLFTMNESVRKKDYGNIIKEIRLLADYFELNNSIAVGVFEKAEKYLSFMSDVINAKDSDEIKNTIRRHAAPASSFILKRQHSFTLSVTGHPGYFVGFEKFDGKGMPFNFITGITLPMGLELSFKTKPNLKTSSSLSAFIQLIDIGAVMNFRMDNSTSMLPATIDIKQIASPGISLNYGFRNSAFNIGLGYQYAPMLRKIKEGTMDVTANAHRPFLRFAWDIPLFYLVKTKK